MEHTGHQENCIDAEFPMFDEHSFSLTQEYFSLAASINAFLSQFRPVFLRP